MIKYLRILLLILLLALLIGCSKAAEISEQSNITPYISSDEFLHLTGLGSSYFAYSFDAPQEATDMHVILYEYLSDCGWSPTINGLISIGEEREPINHLSGTILISLNYGNRIKISVDCAGTATYFSEPQDWFASLPEDVDSLCAKIPVYGNEETAILISGYSKRKIALISLMDFLSPSASLSSYEHVYAITVSFD